MGQQDAAGIRPDVLDFARAMEEALRRRDAERGTRGWMDDPACTDLGLYDHLWEEVAELGDALSYTDNGSRVLAEAADVGNMAMMLWVRAREQSRG